MNVVNETQRTVTIFSQEHYLEIATNAFLIDRKAGNLSPKTIKFYKEKPDRFIEYCNSQQIQYVTQITANSIRSYTTHITIHGFRKQFALSMLRNNVDIFSLQKILGHTSLTTLRTYLAQNDDDTKLAHEKGSPVDNAI